MTPEELAAIREDHRYVETVDEQGDDWYGCLCGENHCHALALLAHIDAITEILRPEHESPYHRAMVSGCLVCAFLRGTP